MYAVQFAQLYPNRKSSLGASVPVYAHFGVTHRCNLTCKMCGLARESKRSSAFPGSSRREAMRKIGVARVSSGGGEPFARDDIEDFAVFLDEGLNTRLLTNGIGIPKSRLMISSIAGWKIAPSRLMYPARFDYICEKEGSWDEAVETMTHISSRLRGRGMPTINCVVSNLNLHELTNLVILPRPWFYGQFAHRIARNPRCGCSKLGGEIHSVSSRNGAQYPRWRRVGTKTRDDAYNEILRPRKKGAHSQFHTLSCASRDFKTGRFLPKDVMQDACTSVWHPTDSSPSVIARSIVMFTSHDGFEEYFYSEQYRRKQCWKPHLVKVVCGLVGLIPAPCFAL